MSFTLWVDALIAKIFVVFELVYRLTVQRDLQLFLLLLAERKGFVHKSFAYARLSLKICFWRYDWRRT